MKKNWRIIFNTWSLLLANVTFKLHHLVITKRSLALYEFFWKLLYDACNMFSSNQLCSGCSTLAGCFGSLRWSSHGKPWWWSSENLFKMIYKNLCYTWQIVLNNNVINIFLTYSTLNYTAALQHCVTTDYSRLHSIRLKAYLSFLASLDLFLTTLEWIAHETQ